MKRKGAPQNFFGHILDNLGDFLKAYFPDF